KPFRRMTFYRAWKRAIVGVGLDDHFVPHDLRHTSNNLTSMAGATTKELMHRMGQSTSQAALHYQHATQSRDSQLASELNKLIALSACEEHVAPSGEDGHSPVVSLPDMAHVWPPDPQGPGSNR